MDKADRKTFLVCPRCGTATVHTLCVSEDSDYRHCDSEGYFHHEPATFNLFKCEGCLQISMYIWSAFHNPHTEFGERIYPLVVAHEPSIPDVVRSAYQEAEKVKHQSTSAYAVLARKVLEAITKERGVFHTNLAQAMTELVAKEKIPPMLAEAATLIRAFGNAGAHSPNSEINGLHVEMIEKFLEALIQYVYIAPATLREFKFVLDIEQEADDKNSN